MKGGGVSSFLIAIAAVALVAGCRPRAGETDGRVPVRLVRPAAAPLSAVATIGRSIFFDSTLAATGRVSCATCHDPHLAYASPVLGVDAGPSRHAALVRATPSLRYLYRTPNFSVGPALADVDDSLLRHMPAPVAARVQKSAPATSGESRMVARGGLFWDGRANTLQDQAMGPLLNPAEMANASVEAVADRIKRAPYAAALARVFGAAVLQSPARLVDEAMFAVARFQIEDPSFHPYSSKFDLFLEGRATLTRAELDGLRAFDDPKRGNCAACHTDLPSADGIPPAFTDYEYEALAVPRNESAAPGKGYDLGVCGPIRADVRTEAAYCGLFRTPSLRNVATRSLFFHNGVYKTLEEVLAFYNNRETHSQLVYRTGPGDVVKYDDLPPSYRVNVDTVDAPFNRHPGDPSPLTQRDMADIIAFLKTLTDGYVARK